MSSYLTLNHKREWGQNNSVCSYLTYHCCICDIVAEKNYFQNKINLDSTMVLSFTAYDLTGDVGIVEQERPYASSPVCGEKEEFVPNRGSLIKTYIPVQCIYG